VTKENVSKCRVNELKRCVKEREHWDDVKHRGDASFYSVRDGRILACLATHTSNSFDEQELETKNGRWQAVHRVVDCLLLTKIVVAMRWNRFTFHHSFGWTSAGKIYRTTNYVIAIHGILTLPLCLCKQQPSQWVIPTSWTLNTTLHAWIWIM